MPRKQKPEMSQSSSLSVADLERMLNERRGELSKLEERRERIAAELAECDARIAELSGGAVSRGGRTRRRRRPGGRRVRNQPALKQVISEILQKSKKPLSLDDIIERVQAAGYRSSSANFRQVAYLNLFNMKRNGEVEHDSETKLYRAKAG